ncbi:MAG TPA: tetratricopeptide repeat protein [Terriglobales bacterium]
MTRDQVEERYQRSDALRIVGITARQLGQWEKSGLVPTSETYSFSDLVQLSKLRDLRSKLPARVIRKAMQACQVSGLANPLTETSMIVTSSHAIAVKHAGAAIDPVRGQFVFDFGQVAERKNIVPIRDLRDSAQDLFLKGVQLEERPETVADAVHVYEQVLLIDPNHAPAYINLGTIFYHRREFEAAERAYRRATEVDQNYALAFFDLGNVLDEIGRVEEAAAAYSRAIELSAEYADAHYNLALALERLRLPRKALKHWMKYVKIDTTGPWSNYARQQIERIVQTDSLRIVWRRAVRA